jgi:hypothetical protein
VINFRRVLTSGGNAKDQGAFMMTLAAMAAICGVLLARPVADMHSCTGAVRERYGVEPLSDSSWAWSSSRTGGVRSAPSRSPMGRLIQYGLALASPTLAAGEAGRSVNPCIWTIHDRDALMAR